MVDLQALSDFLIVAEHANISSAARRTGRPKATLSRRIRALEQTLGVRLFDRDTQGFRLTDAGEELAVRARAPLAQIESAVSDVSADRDRVRGRLRVSASPVFCETVLAAVAGSFVDRFPDVELEVVIEDREASIIERGCDLMIRVNPAPSEELVGRRILRERSQIVTAPENLAARPLYSILAIGQADDPWPIERDDGLDLIFHQPRLRLPTLTHVRKAALAGGGVALLPSFLIGEDVAAGRLATLGTFVGPPAEIWALHLTRRLNNATLRAFLDHLSASLPGSTLETIDPGST